MRWGFPEVYGIDFFMHFQVLNVVQKFREFQAAAPVVLFISLIPVKHGNPQMKFQKDPTVDSSDCNLVDVSNVVMATVVLPGFIAFNHKYLALSSTRLFPNFAGHALCCLTFYHILCYWNSSVLLLQQVTAPTNWCFLGRLQINPSPPNTSLPGPGYSTCRQWKTSSAPQSRAGSPAEDLEEHLFDPLHTPQNGLGVPGCRSHSRASVWQW